MKKHLLSTTAAGAIVALSAPAHADGYLKLFGGMTMLGDDGGAWFQQLTPYTTGSGSYWISNATQTKTFTSEGAPGSYSISNFVSYTWHGGYREYATNTNIDFDIDNGFVVGAAAGKDLGGGLSIEGEIAYRKNDVSVGITGDYRKYNHYYTSHWTGHITSGSEGLTLTSWTSGSGVQDTSQLWGGSPWSESASGDLTSFAVMANVWFDFCPDSTIHPFIGGGLGWADVELEAGGMKASDSGFAWQVGAGVGFDISDSTMLSIEYRFFDVPDAIFEVDGLDIGLDYEVSEIVVGITFGF